MKFIYFFQATSKKSLRSMVNGKLILHFEFRIYTLNAPNAPNNSFLGSIFCDFENNVLHL